MVGIKVSGLIRDENVLVLSHRTDTLRMRYPEIVGLIGEGHLFDEDKTEVAWGFRGENGGSFGLWCYKEGAETCERWSLYVPDQKGKELVKEVFGEENISFSTDC